MAADQGLAEAQCFLGIGYANGEGIPQNYGEAAKYFKLAADQGFAEAQHYLGICYVNGEGVPQNYREAAKCIKMAADQGFAEAQLYLGDCYAHGKGVSKNYEEAEKYYKKVLEQLPDNTYVQTTLGWLYYEKKEYSSAMIYFQKAANAGDAEGYNGMAYLFEYGYGIKKDPNEAMSFIDIAISLKKNDVRYLDTKGEFYLNHGDFDEAKQIWNQCMSIDKEFDKLESTFVTEMKKRLR